MEQAAKKQVINQMFYIITTRLLEQSGPDFLYRCLVHIITQNKLTDLWIRKNKIEVYFGVIHKPCGYGREGSPNVYTSITT